MQRRHHYEQALEEYLRGHRVPYVAVDEARKALVPHEGGGRGHGEGNGEGAGPALKSFDLVLYGEKANLLVEVKGRRIAIRGRGGQGTSVRPVRRFAGPRLESWVTQEDVDSLMEWERLFGEGFQSAFVFTYWCEEQPPAPLFEETLEFRGRWYAVRVVLTRDYRRAMRPRSPRWRTVHLPSAEFDRISGPLWGVLGGVGPLAAPALPGAGLEIA